MNLLLALLLSTTALTPGIQRLQPSELRALMEKGEAVVVDVRGSVPYELGHVRGAIWMPLGLVERRAGELPQEKLVVAYCTCKAEETSLEAARLLLSAGFERVGVLVGGYPAWKEGGFPTESNTPSEPAAVTGAGGAAPAGRLAPPAAVACRRDDLTSHAGRVTGYSRESGRTVVKLHTSAGTDETVVLAHPGSDDASAFFLFEGSPWTPRHRERIEAKKGELREGLSAVAWVCGDGRAWIDWRPGVKFTGAE